MKKILLAIIFIIGLLKLSAQTSTTRIQKFGVKVGVNYCLMNFNKSWIPPAAAVKNIWKPGINLGFLLQLPLNEFITLQPEYAYAQMSGEDERYGASYNISYLSLPVLLRISLTKNIAILAGPEFDLLLQAKRKEKGQKTSIEHQTEERNFAGIIGLEIKIIKSFFVDARYMKGFNHVSLNDRTAVNEFKWSGVAAGIGFRF